MLDQLLKDQSTWISLLIIVISAIAGYSRLESKTSTNERDIERQTQRQGEFEKKIEFRLEQIERKHDELDTRVMEKLLNIERLVARIEGRLIRDQRD